MNDTRRKAIRAAHATAQLLIGEMEALQGKFSDLKSEFETLKDEEQEYYDNMPESLQSGDKGDAATEAIEKFDTLISSFDDIENLEISSFTDAVNDLVDNL
jgi:hypothetical protein